MSRVLGHTQPFCDTSNPGQSSPVVASRPCFRIVGYEVPSPVVIRFHFVLLLSGFQFHVMPFLRNLYLYFHSVYYLSEKILANRVHQLDFQNGDYFVQQRILSVEQAVSVVLAITLNFQCVDAGCHGLATCRPLRQLLDRLGSMGHYGAPPKRPEKSYNTE